MTSIRIMLLALALAASPSAGQVAFLAGTAEALSGTAILIEDPAGKEIRLRLAGLAAPPVGALCPSAGEALPDWECGAGSRLALASVIAGETLECRLTGSAGEVQEADCIAQTRNINQWMLATGWAILRPEWRGRNPEWDAAENLARRARSMLWAGRGR